MKTLTIAIDPGAAGAIAWQAAGGEPHVANMPQTKGDVLGLLRTLYQTHLGFKFAVFLEKVGGYVKGRPAPGSRMFNFGHGAGFLEGVVMAYEMPLYLVPPKSWQGYLNLGSARACASKTQWKNKLKAEAQRRYPRLRVTLAAADALLILSWGLAAFNGHVAKSIQGKTTLAEAIPLPCPPAIQISEL